jgi:hypothetical protein
MHLLPHLFQHGVVTDKHGTALRNIKLQIVMHVPSAAYNLFSLTARLKNNWKLFGDEKKIWIEKDGNKIVFDICIETKRGRVFAINLKRNNIDEMSATGQDTQPAAKPKAKKLTIKQAHDLFGMHEKSWNTQDHDISNPVFPLFVVFTEQPETRLYFVQFSIPLRDGCTTAT